MYNLLSKSFLSWACIFGLASGTVAQVISGGVLPPSFTAVFASASDPIPPSLIGEWKMGGNKDVLVLNPDGSYYNQLMVETRPGGVVDACATFAFRTTRGRFTVNENKLTFHLQTLTVNDFASCAYSFTTPTSVPKTSRYSNEYIVDSFSLQNNGQTLALKQIGGNIATSTQGLYQKSGS